MSEGAKIKIERLIVLADRLAKMLGDDVATLENGNRSGLNTADISFQQMMNTYVREAGGINPTMARGLPLELRQSLMHAIKRMNDTLTRHQRLITRVRSASEGMIQAVAKEVERRRGSQRGYGRTPLGRPQSAGAMVYNSVI